MTVADVDSGDLDLYIKAVIAKDTALGWTFAKPIMDAADKEVKDSW